MPRSLDGRAALTVLVAWAELHPAGERKLQFEYHNPASDLFFYSRYAMLLFACLAMVRIVRDGRRVVFRSVVA